MTNDPPQRVLPIHSPDEYVLPARPDGASPAVLDAHRQTQFMLGGDLHLFAEALNLQLRLVKDAYPSRYRTHTLAAVLALWSRAYTYLGDAALLMLRGSYASTLPLVRAACEVIAAEQALCHGELDEHNQWLQRVLAPDETHKALDYDLGRFFSGEVLASDATLRAVYRPVSDLGRPNFGASLLQVGPDSSNQRMLLTFADPSFHLGWAELVTGWLLALALRQARVAMDAATIFPVSDEARASFEALQHGIAEALGRDDRCSVEEITEANIRRYLIHNFRRKSGTAPRKIII